MHTLSKRLDLMNFYIANYSVCKAATKIEIDMHFAYITAAANCSRFS